MVEKDFIKTIELFEKYPKILKYLENIINDVVEIKTLNDINLAFEKDFNSTFGKTVLIWNK